MLTAFFTSHGEAPLEQRPGMPGAETHREICALTDVGTQSSMASPTTANTTRCRETSRRLLASVPPYFRIDFSRGAV